MTAFARHNDELFITERGHFVRITGEGLYDSEEAAMLAGNVTPGTLRQAWCKHHAENYSEILEYATPWTIDDVRALLTAEERERAIALLPTRFEFPETVDGGAKWVLRAPGGREVIAESPREYDSVEEAHAAAFMVVEAFADIANSALYDLIPNDKE